MSVEKHKTIGPNERESQTNECKENELENKAYEDIFAKGGRFFSLATTDWERPHLWTHDRLLYDDDRYETMHTVAAFAPIYDFIKDQHFTVRVQLWFCEVLATYANVGWLPREDNKQASDDIEETIKDWGEVENIYDDVIELYDINADLEPYDDICDNDTYMQIDKNTIQVSIPWKKSWITAFGFKTKRKITFWRGSFKNTETGWTQAQVMKYRMSKRLDLCVLAYNKVCTSTPAELDIKLIPIITYTKKNGDDKMRSPEWTFIKNDK